MNYLIQLGTLHSHYWYIWKVELVGVVEKGVNIPKTGMMTDSVDSGDPFVESFQRKSLIHIPIPIQIHYATSRHIIIDGWIDRYLIQIYGQTDTHIHTRATHRL